MPNLGGPNSSSSCSSCLLLFGATRLPKLGRSLGQSIRGFKTGLNEESPPDELDEEKKRELEKGDDPVAKS